MIPQFNFRVLSHMDKRGLHLELQIYHVFQVKMKKENVPKDEAVSMCKILFKLEDVPGSPKMCIVSAHWIKMEMQDATCLKHANKE